MKKLVIILISFSVFGVGYTQNISRDEVKNLTKELSKDVKDTARISSLLKIAKFHIFKNGEYKADLDSALTLINEAERINMVVKSQLATGNILFIKAYYLKESGQRKLAKETIEKAIPILRKENDKYLLGEVLFESADYYSLEDSSELSKRIELVQQAIGCFEVSGPIDHKAYCLKALGDLLIQIGRMDEAINALQYCLKTYQSIHYKALQGVYIDLSMIYMNQENFSEALNYGLKALQTAENVKDTTSQLCEINNKLGIIFYNIADFGKAVFHFKNALAIAEKFNDINSVYQITVNIANSYVKFNKPAEAKKQLDATLNKYSLPKSPYTEYNLTLSILATYRELKEFGKATIYSDKLLKMANSGDFDNSAKINMYNAVIKFYIKSGQYTLASTYLSKIKELLSNTTVSQLHAINKMVWFTLDTSKGDYKSAVTHLLEYNKINDTLFNEKKSKQIEQIQVQYATEKKENDIKLRDQQIKGLTQKDLLREANLKRANLIRNITIGAGIVLLVLGSLLFKQFKQKQQANKLITNQNGQLQHLLIEKEWLLKEVHHRVKNNLHTIICLLESQAVYLEDDALKAIENSQHRVYAMSLIHQKLYQSSDVKTVEMANYLPEFIQYLEDSFGVASYIHFELSIENLQLDVSRAVPIALIVNEAVTNCIKYAFPNKAPGIISISMHQSNTDVLIIIADNGIGITKDIDKVELNSLGVALMKGLTEDIDGKIVFENDHGTKISISFQLDPLSKNIEQLLKTKEKEIEI